VKVLKRILTKDRGSRIVWKGKWQTTNVPRDEVPGVVAKCGREEWVEDAE
jgi:hypothetical protein